MPRGTRERSSSTASTPGKRDSLALGENRFTHFRGDAYNLFTTASEKQGFLVKGQLLTLMRRYRYQDAPHEAADWRIEKMSE